MKIKVIFVMGIIGIAAVAGVLQALSTPRTGDGAEEGSQKQKGKA